MGAQRRTQVVYAQTAVPSSVLHPSAYSPLELFFVVAFIGFLIVVELTAPFAVTPEWRRSTRWITLMGCVTQSFVVAEQVFEVLGVEVLRVCRLSE